MKQILYKIIYQKNINWVLRSINKVLSPVLPKKIKIPPSGILKVKNAEGEVLKIRTNQTSYLTTLIYWKGGYLNFEYTDIFIKLIKKVSTFYDIGANIGYYSLIAALENKNIHVTGFEPASGSLFYFKENVRLNNFSKITIESDALSDKNGIIDFYEVFNKKYKYLKHNLAGESNAGSKKEGRDFKINQVKTLTLDNYVKLKSEENIDLIKMDTEGTENLILEKSDFVLKNMKPIVICETLFNYIEKELEELFSYYGYEFYNHVEGGLRKQETIIREKDNGIRNCFFVHPSKFNLIEEFVVS